MWFKWVLVEECFVDLTTQYVISTTSGLSAKAVKSSQGKARLFV